MTKSVQSQATTFAGSVKTIEWQPYPAAPELAAHRASYLAKLTERVLSPRDLREMIAIGNQKDRT